MLLTYKFYDFFSFPIVNLTLMLALRRRRRYRAKQAPKRRFWVRPILTEEAKQLGEWENPFLACCKQG